MKTLNIFLILIPSILVLTYIIKIVNSNYTSLNTKINTETMNNNHNHLLNSNDKDKLHNTSISKADYEIGNYKQETNHSCYMYKDRLGAVPSDMNI